MTEQEAKKTKVDFSIALTAIKAIREKEGDKRGMTGIIPCPSCKQDFHYSIANVNGHIHGRCSGCGAGFVM